VRSAAFRWTDGNRDAYHEQGEGGGGGDDDDQQLRTHPLSLPDPL
jgi:hypothetical protein